MPSNDHLDKLITHIQKLEKRITSLENKEAVTIQGHLETQQIKPLNIDEDKLLSLYHDIPQILSEYAIEVSLTAKSYRQQTLDIIVERAVRGNYWVIALENGSIRKYYLLPNGNLKLRLYRLDSLEYLFNLKGDKVYSSSDFTLIKPALVSIYPSGQEWKLKQKGELYIGKYDAKQQLVSDLEDIISNHPNQVDRIFDLLTKINQNQRDMEAEIKSIRNRISNIEPKSKQLVRIYQNEPEYFLAIAGGSQQVSLTTDTLNSILVGQTDKIHLGVSNDGEYVIKKTDQGEFLFPHPDVIFDRRGLSISSQANLFICQGDLPIAVMGKDIEIRKPATVRKSGDVWSIVDVGELMF